MLEKVAALAAVLLVLGMVASPIVLAQDEDTDEPLIPGQTPESGDEPLESPDDTTTTGTGDAPGTGQGEPGENSSGSDRGIFSNQNIMILAVIVVVVAIAGGAFFMLRKRGGQEGIPEELTTAGSEF